MIHLRDYQDTCIGGVRNAYRAGKRSPLLVSPTGSGKTVMFAYISNGTSRKGNKVLILVHRQELVDQTTKTLNAFGVGHGVIAAGRTPDRTHPVPSHRKLRMKKPAKRLHVIPLGDLEHHEASTECWCHPLDTKDGIVTHNAKDCREQMERSGKPTGKIWCQIAEIYDASPVHSYLIGGPEDPLQLLRRIGTPKAFMDLEGLRIVCANFMAKWDARNS